MVKNVPAVQETWVQFLSRQDPLEEGMATHSSILAWRIPWTEELGVVELDMTEQLTQPQWEHVVQHGELWLMHHGDPDGKEAQKGEHLYLKDACSLEGKLWPT